MKHKRYVIAGLILLLGTQGQLLPSSYAQGSGGHANQQPTTSASLTPAQKLAQAQAFKKLTPAQKQAKLAQAKQAKQAQSPATKTAPKAVKSTTPQPKSTSKNSSENDKLIQDFLTAAKKLPEYKKPQPADKDTAKLTPQQKSLQNKTNPSSSGHEKEVEKVFEAYKKMQTHVKEISLTKSQEKEIRKAANNLFDYKIGEGSPIKHMAWKGYKAVPESAKTTLTQPSKK